MTQSQNTDLEKLRAIRDSVAEKGVLRKMTFKKFYYETVELAACPQPRDEPHLFYYDLYDDTWKHFMDDEKQWFYFFKSDELDLIKSYCVSFETEEYELVEEIAELLKKDCLARVEAVHCAMGVEEHWRDLRTWIDDAIEDVKTRDCSSLVDMVDLVKRATEGLTEHLDNWHHNFEDIYGFPPGNFEYISWKDRFEKSVQGATS